jgi:hypothetical protein
MFFDNRKVFCIGFNKTGTKSLHQFFRQCNLTSVHNHRWTNYSKVRFGWLYFLIYQCYSDGEQCDFVELERWFPNSLFILNNRNEKDWLYSRIKHVLRHNEDIDIETIFSSPNYGKMAKDFFIDEENAITKWISERRLYVKQARLHFRGKQNFLEVDISQHEDWTDRLIKSLKENKFRIDFNGTSNGIHENRRRSDDLSNQVLLKKYKTMVDEKLGIH